MPPKKTDTPAFDPAPWIKRVHEMWLSVAGDVDPDETADDETVREVSCDLAFSHVSGWHGLTPDQRDLVISKVRF
jgi:hypothetical protein